MPGYGLNNSSIPIISYNYGAKKGNRIAKPVQYGLLYISAIMLGGILMLQLFAEQIVGFFSVTKESLCIGASDHHLRVLLCRSQLSPSGRMLGIGQGRILPRDFALAFHRTCFAAGMDIFTDSRLRHACLGGFTDSGCGRMCRSDSADKAGMAGEDGPVDGS